MASPAAPALASTLLDSELKHQKMPTSARTFSVGIKALDQGLSPSLWTGGKLIGVVSGSGLSLSEQIISEHLLSFKERIVRDREPGNGFIIAPHDSNIITSIHTRITDRLSHLPVPNTQPNAVQYLENVQLLQYFDFAGLTESVAEVSALLFDMDNSSTAQKAILCLEGISTAIENSRRRNGVVQANALLSSVLRTLTYLSRTYPCLLILLDLGWTQDAKGDEAIQSAFASATGSDLRHQPRGELGRTLESALDVMVVVHDARGSATDGSIIVEVVKDRVGDALGQWTVWKLRK